METIWKIFAGAIISVILATTLRGIRKEISIPFSLVVCSILAICGLKMSKSAFHYLQDLQELAGIESALLKPVLNVCGIGLATHLCATFCQEAGERTVGKIVSLCGNIAAVCTSIPLLEILQSMIREFLR